MYVLLFKDVRNRLFYFGSVSVRFKKNLDSVRDKFGSVRLGDYSYLLLILTLAD